MSLRVELAEYLMTSPPHVELEIGSSEWRLYVLGVSRIGSDSFVQMALDGPRFCTVTARLPTAHDPDAKARELVALVLQWLASGTLATQAFLESPDCVSATA
jgi:hypothetical protein